MARFILIFTLMLQISYLRPFTMYAMVSVTAAVYDDDIFHHSS